MKIRLEKNCNEQLQSLQVAKMKNVEGEALREKLQLDLYFLYRKQKTLK